MIAYQRSIEQSPQPTLKNKQIVGMCSIIPASAAVGAVVGRLVGCVKGALDGDARGDPEQMRKK